MATAISTLLQTQTEPELLDYFLTEAAIKGINVRGMQAERLARGQMETDAKTHAQYQSLREQIVNGGYLDDATGPWLTLLAFGVWRIVRSPATFAIHQVRLSDAKSVGPKQVNDRRHVAVSTSGKLFRNIESAQVPLNSNVDVQFKAETPGADSNVAINTITKLQTPITGVTVNNPAIGATGSSLIVGGANEEGDSSLRTRCRNKWNALGAGGNKPAYAYWIPQSFIEAGESATVTRWYIDDANPFGPGSIGVWLANDSGPATAGEISTVNAYLQLRKALGSGELRTQAASTVAQTITCTVYHDGTNGSVASDVSSALLNLGAAHGVGEIFYRASITAALMAVSGVINVTITAPASDLSLSSNEVIQVTPDATLSAI